MVKQLTKGKEWLNNAYWSAVGMATATMLTDPALHSSILPDMLLPAVIIRCWRMLVEPSGMPFAVRQPSTGNLYTRMVTQSMMMVSFAQSVWKLSETSRLPQDLLNRKSAVISTASPQEENNKPETAMVVTITIMAVFHSPRNTGGECHGRT